MAGNRGSYAHPESVIPGVVAAIHRNANYRDMFPIGASLYDWAVMGA